MKSFAIEMYEKQNALAPELSDAEMELVSGGRAPVYLGTVIVKGNRETGETTVTYD